MAEERKAVKPTRFLLVLLFVTGAIRVSDSSLAAGDWEVEKLRAFAKLYGYVRYFHPSDEASEVDWERFAVHGVRGLSPADNSEEVRRTLLELFEPIAPTMRLYRTGESVPEISRGRGEAFELVAWQHLGLGLGRRPYESFRTHRTTSVPADGFGFGTVAQSLKARAYRGTEFRLRAAIRTDERSQAQLWLRVDRHTAPFDITREDRIDSTEWATYEITGHVAEDAESFSFGGLLFEDGRIWLDDFELFVRDPGKSWRPLELQNSRFESSTSAAEGWSTKSPGYIYEVVENGGTAGSRSLPFVVRCATRYNRLGQCQEPMSCSTRK